MRRPSHALIGVAALAWMVAVAGSLPAIAARQQQGPDDGSSPAAAGAFLPSTECLACHNGLTASSGEDVSIGVSWRASMMANSARDPYWQAAVRRETLDHPMAAAEIENECAICHMPMTAAPARAAGRHTDVFAHLTPGGAPDGEQALARDGVSCALCHQIGPEGLGTRDSFVGGFVIAPNGDGPRMLGPHTVEPGLASVMRSATGATPADASHLRESELCATCHTLITTALDASGRPAGSLPEQVPYLEWQHSAWRGERSCQSCHMPRVEGPVAIASVLAEPRDGLARHTFLGGNFFMLRMLNRHRDELGVSAPAAELEAAAQATLRQLGTQTGSIAIRDVAVSARELAFQVRVANATGHKLPTGYPSRRVWLHLVVRDRDARVVFESGGIAPDGRIQGNDNDLDPLAIEPHHEVIRSPGDVQVYEAIMGDPAGRPTTGLLQATQFLKDNRLLPRGFDKMTAAADIAVRGGAIGDADFTGDGDRVQVVVAVSEGGGPWSIEAVLRYQPIAFRWADNLRGYRAAEPRRFVSWYDGMASGSSAVIARDSARTSP